MPSTPKPTANYAPTLTLPLAIKRAQMLAQIRAFFAERCVLEVTTPILSQAGNTDVFIESIRTSLNGKSTGYLHTSPEFAMKRLLAAWQVPIYQICSVFRDHEKGARHNIEFGMLEWYRPDFSLADLAEELRLLISTVMGKTVHFEQLSYKQAFKNALNLCPFGSDLATLKQAARQHGIRLDMGDDLQGWLDLLFSHLIEPTLGKDAPTLLIDYPPATAALAKTAMDDDGHLVAKRFELYMNGLEIANAYDELANGDELRARFMQDNQLRDALGLPIMPIDENLLAACDDLPACSGIALGLDRLFMVRENLSDIRQAIAITTDNA